MRERWSARALDDRLAIIDYLNLAGSPAIAMRIDEAIVDRVHRLLDMPLSGRAGHFPTTREAVVGGTPYIVIYSVNDDVLRVVRIVHGAQDWQRRP